jgi:hypothetical protein
MYSAAGIASIAASSATIPTFAKPRLSNFPSHLASLPIPDPYKDRVFLDLFQTLESELERLVETGMSKVEFEERSLLHGGVGGGGIS